MSLNVGCLSVAYARVACMGTFKDPLRDLVQWWQNLQEEQQAQEAKGGTGDEDILRRYRFHIERNHQLLELVAHLAQLTDEEHQASDIDAGTYLTSLQRAYRDTEVTQLHDLLTFMRDTHASAQRSRVIDVESLNSDVRRAYSLIQDLTQASNDLVTHVEHEALDHMVSAIQDDAWQTPGVKMQVTEQIAGPDGQLTTVRDVVSVGPTTGTAGPEVTLNSVDQMHLLGLDAESTPGARERVMHLRMGQTLQRLGLAQATASQHEVERAAIGRISDRSRVDVLVRETIGRLPADIHGLQPGHIYALRAALHSMLVDLFVDMRGRGAHGDTRAVGMSITHLTSAMALSYAPPFYLPIAELENTTPGSPGPPDVGENHDIFVFHDLPLPLGQGVEALAWLFPLDPTGQVEDVAEVVLRDTDGFHLEMGHVSLVEGEASKVAQRVLTEIHQATWEVSKRRKLPGAAGDRAWTAALGRCADTEMRSGSLARLRRHKHTTGPQE